MKKILISLFLIISVIGLSESDRETGITAERNETPVIQNTTDDGGETVENPEQQKTTAGFYEYRPEILIQLDEQMKSAGRGSVGQLNAKYEQELNAYLEMYSYDSDRIFYLANEYMLLNNYHRANKIFLKDNKDIKNVFGAATTYRFMGIQ